MNEQPEGTDSGLLDLVPAEDDLGHWEGFLNDQGERVVFLED